jgi:hypothetical protein
MLTPTGGSTRAGEHLYAMAGLALEGASGAWGAGGALEWVFAAGGGGWPVAGGGGW